MENGTCGLPLTLLLLLLFLDQWHPAFLLCREDHLICAAALLPLLAALGINWFSFAAVNELDSYMNYQGFSIVYLFLALYIYYYHEREFWISVRVLSFLIWFSAIAGAIMYEMPEVYEEVFGGENEGSDEHWLNYFKYDRLYLPYISPIPAATIWIMGFWMPLTGHKWDWILKSIYVYVIFMTQSRSGWLGLAVTIVLFALRMGRQFVRWALHLKRWQKAACLIALACAAVWAAQSDLMRETVIPYVEDILISRLGSLTLSIDLESGLGSDGIRLRHWAIIWESFCSEGLPAQIFGNGIGSVSMLIEAETDRTTRLIADNMFMSLLYESGLLAVSAILLILGKGVVQFFRRGTLEGLMKSGTLGLFGAAVSACFYDAQTLDEIMLLMMIWGAVILVDYRREWMEKRETEGANPPSRSIRLTRMHQR